ncbi:MAG: hypothetical protein IMF26_02225 [Candidatus Fermentithermobacillus carboniphilus]|uniref:Butyrate kinase n=1 Tax=Candidatus Fermentithermobacillus carboniphilus TaxID=3085328 RepID=A0AAT9LCV1_9FIRM|nr:MAG: hypothetical protein IMF26_02225 [Candidatus Fermentithermobacillus carboniphilus]
MKTVVAVDPGFSGTRLFFYSFDERYPALDTGKTRVEILRPGEDPFSRLDRVNVTPPDVVVLPGGSYRPSPPGVYRLSDTLASDASCIAPWHPRNQMTIMAYRYCLHKKIPGIVVEPMNSAELLDEAVLSGYPAYKRRGCFYAVPQRAAWEHWVSRHRETGRDLSGITVYLGEEACVSAHKGTRVVDTSDPIMGEGPYGWRSAGTLPATAFISYMHEGGLGERPLRKLKEDSGVYGYARNSAGTVESLVEALTKGDEKAVSGVVGMAYQVSKEIGRQTAALSGKIDVVVVCGPLVVLRDLVDGISRRVSKWAPVEVVREDLVPPVLIKEGIDVLMGKSVRDIS